MSKPLEEDSIPVPIEWHIPEGMTSRYATNLVIQRTEHEYVLSFFEARLPIILGDPEERVGQIQALGSVKATCVAQVVVAAQ